MTGREAQKRGAEAERGPVGAETRGISMIETAEIGRDIRKTRRKTKRRRIRNIRKEADALLRKKKRERSRLD
jgi:hypothetical protein